MKKKDEKLQINMEKAEIICNILFLVKFVVCYKIYERFPRHRE